MDGQYWKGDRTMSTNEWLLTSDFWQFLKPWHGRRYEYEIFIASCADNIYDLENERWLLGDMIDHVGIYGSRVAEGLSAFNVGLVLYVIALHLSHIFSISHLDFFLWLISFCQHHTLTIESAFFSIMDTSYNISCYVILSFIGHHSWSLLTPNQNRPVPLLLTWFNFNSSMDK